MLQPSDRCVRLIKAYESRHLESYPDPLSELGRAVRKAKLRATDYRKLDGWQQLRGVPWTIGWGHTSTAKPEQAISAAQADALLAQDCENAAIGVRKLLRGQLTQDQFDALVSFAYNVGVYALARSQLLKYVNNGKWAQAAAQFELWDNGPGPDMNGDGKPDKVEVPGLVKRRLAEQALFLGQYAKVLGPSGEQVLVEAAP